MRYNSNPNFLGIDLYGIYKYKPKINFQSKFETNKNLHPSLFFLETLLDFSKI